MSWLHAYKWQADPSTTESTKSLSPTQKVLHKSHQECHLLLLLLDDVDEHLQNLKDDNTEKIKLGKWNPRSKLYVVELGAYGMVDAYAARIAKLVEGFNFVAVDGSKMSPSEQPFYLINGIPLENEWPIFRRTREGRDGELAIVPAANVSGTRMTSSNTGRPGRDFEPAGRSWMERPTANVSEEPITSSNTPVEAPSLWESHP